MACDGLWDVVDNQEAVNFVKRCQQEGELDPESISKKLVQLALTKGSTDNISVMVVFLK